MDIVDRTPKNSLTIFQLEINKKILFLANIRKYIRRFPTHFSTFKISATATSSPESVLGRYYCCGILKLLEPPNIVLLLAHQFNTFNLLVVGKNSVSININD